MDPTAGILLIALGSIGAASLYVPFKKVKSWAWESYWISQGVAARLIAPLIFTLIFVPKGELMPILKEATASAKWMAVFGWSILMALYIAIANIWGILLREWKGAKRKTMIVLLVGIVVLILSTFIVKLG